MNFNKQHCKGASRGQAAVGQIIGLIAKKKEDPERWPARQHVGLLLQIREILTRPGPRSAGRITTTQ